MKASEVTTLLNQKSRVGVVIAKDGGWGWVIVFSAFVLFMLSAGLIYSLGILLTEFATYFNEGKSVTAWVISIAAGTSSCTGPFICGLTNRYGCRVISCAGALLTCFGMLISIPAPNVFYLFFSIGVVIGTGVGMMFLPSVIIVNSYFEKKRALAIGISMCGSSIGTLVMTPTIEYVLSYYGNWRSTLFLLAGVVLNGVVFGSLYRPPDNRVVPAEVYQDEENSQGIVIFEPIPEIQEEHILENPSEWKNLFPYRKVYRTQSEPIEIKDFKRIAIRRANSFFDLEYPELQERGNVLSVHPTSSLLPRQHFLSRSNRDEEISKTTMQKIRSSFPSTQVASSYGSRGKFSTSGLLYRKDIFYTASLLTVPEYRDNPPEYYETLVTSVVEIESGKGKWREIWDGLKQVMALSLLKDRAYQIILLSRFIASLGIYAPYFFFVDRALDIKVSSGSYLISFIGVGNIFGRLIIGFISDYESINRILLYKICITICGIMIAMSSMCYSFSSMVVVSVIYGFTIGAFTSTLPVILVDTLGIAKLSNAYGLLMCFQGIGNLVGLPAAGLIRDVTGSYALGFISSGVLVIFSALMCCFIASAKCNTKSDKKVSNTMSDLVARSSPQIA